jgi:hypothetical protein
VSDDLTRTQRQQPAKRTRQADRFDSKARRAARNERQRALEHVRIREAQE